MAAATPMIEVSSDYELGQDSTANAFQRLSLALLAIIACYYFLIS
jgi:hypothetical protein